MSMETFDKEDVYDTHISPLMQQIITLCKEHGIPMLASFVYKRDDVDRVYNCSTLLNAKGPRYHEPLDEALRVIRQRMKVVALTSLVLDNATEAIEADD